MLSESERARYSRHLILPNIGEAGQLRLKASSVLVVGAGGLGAPVLLYLVAAGVGRIGIVDFDRVDETNLHRQVLFGTASVGQPKIDAAKARLADLNPDITLTTHDARLTSENALDIVRDYDLVIDGTDNFPTRYLVNDACVLLGKPNVYGSIFRFEGQVSVFDAKRGPCYRCLYPDPPPPHLVPSCAEGGVLGVLPGVVGTIQATEAIKLITGAGEPLIARLLLFDALAMSFRQMKLRKDPNCKICGEHPTVTALIDYEEFCNAMNPDLMTVSELNERIAKGEALTIVDVREQYEWDAGHLATARHVPLSEFRERFKEIPPDGEIVMVCRMGGRSAQAQQYLKMNGYTRVKNLTGGMLAWRSEIDPSMRVK